MANKKEIILTVIALLIVAGGFFALSRNQIARRQELNIPITSPTKIVSPMSVQWTTYHNQIYHYRIDYPPGFQVSRLFTPETPESVAFANEDDAWAISVHIESTLFHTLEEWVEENRQNDIKYQKENLTPEGKKLPTVIIERDILISGTYRGVVVYYPEMGKSFLKNVFFIKDGNLFQISINNPNIDHERVWKSFQFE